MDGAIQRMHAPGVDVIHPSVQGVAGVSLDLKVYDVHSSERAGRGSGIGTRVPSISSAGSVSCVSVHCAESGVFQDFNGLIKGLTHRW